MHLPRIIATVLAVRQAAQIIPSEYCSPECPTCKTEIAAFNVDISCAVNSTFITFCGICQECVITYSLENPDAGTNRTEIDNIISNVLEQCSNSSGAEEVQSLEVQVTRIEDLVATATTTPTGVWSNVMTTAPTQTTATRTTSKTWDGSMGDPTGAWTSILSTATWASYYYSRLSADSSLQAASSSWAAEQANLTAQAARTTSKTSTNTPTASPIASSEPLNKSWVVGPIIGSILGVSTVFIVIYFTRRRSLPPPPSPSPELPLPKRTQSQSTSSTSSHHNSLAQFKAQLHSDSIPLGELDNTEICEMPAREPVGMEMSSSRIMGTKDDIDEDVWAAMPISPLPALFKEVEIRDEKMEGEEVKHETFYNP